MKIYYDTEVDAVDIEFRRVKVIQAKEATPAVLLNIDKMGTPLSLEILGASKRCPHDFRKLLTNLPKINCEKTRV